MPLEKHTKKTLARLLQSEDMSVRVRVVLLWSPAICLRRMKGWLLPLWRVLRSSAK